MRITRGKALLSAAALAAGAVAVAVVTAGPSDRGRPLAATTPTSATSSAWHMDTAAAATARGIASANAAVTTAAVVHPKPTTARVTRKPTSKPTHKATHRPTPKPTEKPAEVYYANCAAAKRAGAAPLHRGDPGYRKGLDRDGDGVACES